jgi:photosystem II stability/assembly factor-like uncharacterized protein
MASDRVYAYEHGILRGNEPIPGTKQISEAAGAFSSGGPVLYVLFDHRWENGGPKVSGGLLVSHDRGATWKQVHRSILDNLGDPWVVPHLRGLAVADGRRDELYLSYANLRLKGEEGTFFGVAHTTDGGANWEYLWKSASKPPANVHDAWLTQWFGTYWGENPLDIALRKNLVIATDLGRTMRSVDGGKTWDAVYSRRMDDGGYTTTGLDVTTSYGVHFDPFDSNRVFITYTDIGLFRSETGGDTWVTSIEGAPRTWANTTYWMEFDPELKGRAWAVMSGLHDLPRTISIRRDPAHAKGGVVISSDGGRTWRKSNDGMEESACTHIVLDPASSKDSRTLYVAAMGRGVYRSTDGGKRWELKTKGFPANPMVWRLNLQGNTLWAVVARREDDGKPGSPNDGGLYRSTDHGESWTQVPLPSGLNGPSGIAFAPGRPDHIYLSAAGRTDMSGKNHDGGIFVSGDGGKSWTNTLADPMLYDVTVDPGNPNRVYATGYESSAWRSDDLGQHWRRLRGFNFRVGHRVIPDPRNRDRVFITTFGGSVWYGPADGDPKALEDIVSPEVATSTMTFGK